VTFTRLEHCTLIVMAVVEVIYAVAATLWIVVVLAALCFGGVVIAKYRRRRRRISRVFDAACMPLALVATMVNDFAHPTPVRRRR
jgi:amino acid transporter